MSAATKVISPIGTLSYPHLDKAQPGMNGGKEKYSATVVFSDAQRTTGKKEWDAMQAAVLEVAVAKWGPNFKKGALTMSTADAIREGHIRSPFRKDAEIKGYAIGSIFINARSDQKPGAVYVHAGTNGKPAEMPADKVKTELYAGSQVRVSLAAFAYENSGNTGVAFALNNVQKIGEGERIDGRKDASDEFTVDLSQKPADLASII